MPVNTRTRRAASEELSAPTNASRQTIPLVSALPTQERTRLCALPDSVCARRALQQQLTLDTDPAPPHLLAMPPSSAPRPRSLHLLSLRVSSSSSSSCGASMPL
eukprot:2726666-Rhodomonas_salina.1